MSIDWNKIQAEATRQQQQNESNLVKRVVALADAVDRRLTTNPNDEIVEAVEVLLGVKEGGTDKVLELLGLNADEPDAVPDATTAGEEDDAHKYIKILNPDGTIDATLDRNNPVHKRRIDELLMGGYNPVTQDGRLVELRPHSSARAVQNDDPDLPVWDKKGKDTGDKKPLSWAVARSDKYKVVHADTAPFAPARIQELKLGFGHK